MSGLLSDEEYDRRLLARMQRDMGRTTNPTTAEQRAALGGAAAQAGQMAFDLLVPQSPADFALMAAFGPGGRALRLPAAAGLLSLEAGEAEARRRLPGTTSAQARGELRRLRLRDAQDEALAAAPPSPAGVSDETPFGVNSRGPNATPYGSGESPLDFYGPGQSPYIGDNVRDADGNRIGQPGVLAATGEARPGKPGGGGLREAIPVPDVPGAAPDRSPGTVIRHNPARGDSARFADFQARIGSEPTLLDEITATARAGEDIGRRWYNTEGTRQRFIAELGEDEGHRAWSEFMQRIGAASPGNAVYPNIRQASYYFAEPEAARAARQGHLATTGSYPRPPEPYGSLTQQYQGALDDLVNRGQFIDNAEPTRAPKPRGFTNSLLGKPENIAADKHFMRFIGMASGDPRFLHGSATISQELANQIAERFPDIAAANVRTRTVKNAAGQETLQTNFNAARAVRENGGADGELFRFIRQQPTVWDEVPRDNEYGAYERLALDIANRMNMTPAQLQASLWMGAARRTGVRADSLDTFDNIFNRVVDDRAAERGLSPDEVFRRFATRAQPLMVPPLAVGAAGLLDDEERAR